jgi:site-specific DNA-methyltransferase (cytosine-N4-specific)
VISESAFSKDNGGAIPSNVIIASNTDSSDIYIKKCKEHGIEIHPARMAPAIPEFFIKYLTHEGDIVRLLCREQYNGCYSGKTQPRMDFNRAR